MRFSLMHHHVTAQIITTPPTRAKNTRHFPYKDRDPYRIEQGLEHSDEGTGERRTVFGSYCVKAHKVCPAGILRVSGEKSISSPFTEAVPGIPAGIPIMVVRQCANSMPLILMESSSPPRPTITNIRGKKDSGQYSEYISENVSR